MVQWFNLCGAFQTWPTITLGSNLTDVAAKMNEHAYLGCRLRRSCWRWHLKVPRSESLEAHGSTQEATHPIVTNDIKWSILRFVWMDSFCFFWICQVDWLIEKVDYMLFLSLHILGSNPSLSWLEMHSIRWTHRQTRRTMNHPWTNRNINFGNHDFKMIS